MSFDDHDRCRRRTCEVCRDWASPHGLDGPHHELCLHARIDSALAARACGTNDPDVLAALLAEASAEMQRQRERGFALASLTTAVRREHNARAAWLASLPDGSCGNPPSQALLDAEAATREALRRAT